VSTKRQAPYLLSKTRLTTKNETRSPEVTKIICVNAQTPISTEAKGWVLYDGRCGFCSAGARRMASFLNHLHFRTTPLQTPWVVDRLGSQKALNPGEMALLTREGKLLFGVDAYVHVLEQTPGLKPFASIARTPWIHRLLERAYRWVADHRLQISTVCRLKPDLPSITR
jgi:predicted DCC family thiol-disulfide oxidoreductase YuxK